MRPACAFNKCDIVDIAPDIDLNRKVQAFIGIELLDGNQAYARHAERMLADSELDKETPATILALRSELQHYRERSSKK